MNIIGMSNVSFLTKNIQYTTLKLNFALRANVKKTAFPMIVILTAILKNKSRPLSLLKFEIFSRRSNLYNIGLKIPANYSMGFNVSGHLNPATEGRIKTRHLRGEISYIHLHISKEDIHVKQTQNGKHTCNHRLTGAEVVLPAHIA